MNKETIRVAAVQMDVALMKPEENLAAVVSGVDYYAIVGCNGAPAIRPAATAASRRAAAANRSWFCRNAVWTISVNCGQCFGY